MSANEQHGALKFTNLNFSATRNYCEICAILFFILFAFTFEISRFLFIYISRYPCFHISASSVIFRGTFSPYYPFLLFFILSPFLSFLFSIHFTFLGRIFSAQSKSQVCNRDIRKQNTFQENVYLVILLLTKELLF